MKYRLFLILIVTTFYFPEVKGQSSVSLSTGLSMDLKNTPPFFEIPVHLMWNPFKRSKGFFLEGVKTFGINKISHDDAYTPDPDLPAHIRVRKAVRSSSFSGGLGGTILLYTSKKEEQLILRISGGVSERRYLVSYGRYDRKNYEIMNPDVDYAVTFPYLSMSGCYDFVFRENRMFIMLRAQTAEIRPSIDRYPFSFKRIIPLQLTYGYRLFYSKK